MPPLQKVEVYAYFCHQCGKRVEAQTPWRDDSPPGYYFSIRNVTPARYHHQSGEIFVCSKECLLNFVTYGITANTRPIRPIGREGDRWVPPSSGKKSGA